MSKQPANPVLVGGGTGVGVFLVDLLLDNDIVQAVIKGVLAALIAAVLVVVVEGRR